MTRDDAWALAMGVEKWIERWMTHYCVPGEYRHDVRHAVMLGLVERADRWQPELGNWMTFCTPWIRSLVPRERRQCERELGNVDPRLPLPIKCPPVRHPAFDGRRSRMGPTERAMEDIPSDSASIVDDLRDRQRDRAVAYARLRLRARERVVIELALAGYTIKAIGEQLGISRERARQIHIRAVDRMKKFIVDSDGEDDAGALHHSESHWLAPGPANLDDARGMVRARVRVSP